MKQADQLYAQASTGIAALPDDCRPAILAVRLIYAEIGQQLRRDGLDPVTHRAVVSTPRNTVLLLGAFLMANQVPAGREPVPLPAIAWLVAHAEAAAASEALNPQVRTSRPLGERAEWMLDLFERQRLRQRRQRCGRLTM